MSSTHTQTAEAIAWTPDKGEETTATLESFAGYPVPPADAKNIQKSYEDGKYVLRYTITTNSQDTTYSITGSVSQEPLATHAMFGPKGDYKIEAAEWKKWKLWEADPKDAELSDWKPDGTSASAGMKKYYEYRNRGLDDYLLGTVTMRVVKEDQSEPSFDKLGRIAAPPKAPPLPDSRTWLLVGIDGERVGQGRWKVTREYRASGAGGWDTTIYSKA